MRERLEELRRKLLALAGETEDGGLEIVPGGRDAYGRGFDDASRQAESMLLELGREELTGMLEVILTEEPEEGIEGSIRDMQLRIRAYGEAAYVLFGTDAETYAARLLE